MSSNTTVPTPARRPEISAARGHLRSFADVMGEELDVNSSLPALQQQDGVEWDELRNQVHGHENLLTAAQGAVTVTRGDFTTLGSKMKIRGNVTVLTENVRLLGEGLGAQIRAVSESTDHLTNLMNNQAGVNTRLKALNKNTVARFHNKRLYGAGSDELEPLYCLATGRVIEDVTSRAQLRNLSPRRMTEILSELGEPPQASVRGRRRELKKLYGADLLLMRVVGEEEDSD
ncbi:hypothetical protein E4U15_007528 [Claviceps sp. LM218 group G6]|nr:hypothetical protein E4U15_007528 [Claviceps sp. LM218 group G6]